jgi:hypothetical protein
VIFANLASFLPTDTSALERSISALESCISALESSIAALASELPFWEYFGFVSAALVVVGVLLELHDIWHRHGEDKTAWALSFFGVSKSPEKPRFIKKYGVELASVVLVASGVAGEVGAGLMIESKNTALRAIDIQLRSKNSALRSASDQLVGLATKEARDAEGTAKQFEGQIADSNAKAASAEATAEAERLARVKIEASVGWRRLSDQKKKDIGAALTRFGIFGFLGRTANISYDNGNPEEAMFAADIAEALHAGHIGAGPPVAIMVWKTATSGDKPDTGVIVTPTPDAVGQDLADSIIKELNARGFDASRPKQELTNAGKQARQQVWLYVAPRPEGPQGEYKLQAEREAKAKKTHK